MSEQKVKKFIGQGLKEAGTNRNVLNVLRVLIEDENSIVYLPADYERGTRKRVDEKVHQGLRYAPVAMPVTDFLPHMERFNFSVRGLKEVMVEDEETQQLESKKVFRAYNVIRDGELHIQKLEAKLSPESFDQLVAAGILYDQVGRQVLPGAFGYNADYVYTINLGELPLVSTHWAQPTNLGFIDMIMEEQYLTELVKSLKKIEKEWRANLTQEENISISDKETTDLYIEKSKYASEEVTEEIQAYAVVYRVKSNHLTSRIKIETSVDELKAHIESYNELTSMLKASKKELSYKRFLIRAIAFAIDRTKRQGSFNWSSPEKLPRSKGKLVQRAEISEDIVLEKITWEETVKL